MSDANLSRPVPASVAFDTAGAVTGSTDLTFADFMIAAIRAGIRASVPAEFLRPQDEASALFPAIYDEELAKQADR